MCQPSNVKICLHCEVRPQANRYRLCKHCVAQPGLRNIYRKRKGWTAAWDARIQQLADRARDQLPLFPRGETVVLPDRPCQAPMTERDCSPRIYPIRLELNGEER